MESHPELELRSHDGYNSEAIKTADDDMMKAVLNPLAFPFLEELRSSTRVRTFEEILSSPTDEDQDYLRLTGQGLRSTLHPESLGLILSGQPVGALADLSKEFEEAGREVLRALDSEENVLGDPGEATPSGSEAKMADRDPPADSGHADDPAMP